ncbi:MAG: biopolymer transporter ExbD, partial [Thermodesulfobacteriota bacterium]
LVLLIIFMVTTPILYQGVNVELPKTSSTPIPSMQNEKKIVVTLTESKDIFIEDKRYSVSELKLAVRKSILDEGKELADEQVFLRADSSVPYGFVVQVMNEIRKAGIEKLGLITDPSGAKK